MVDSAYASASGADTRKPKPIAEGQMQFNPERMWSPSVSAVSCGTHIDGNGFMLSGTTAGSMSGTFESLDLSTQGMWPAHASAANTPVSLEFIQTVSPTLPRAMPYPTGTQVMSNQHVPMMVQTNGPVAVRHAPFLQSQSPDLVSQPAGPSRTSSRATMSGYVSGASSVARATGPFHGPSPAGYGSAPVHRQIASNVASASFMDESAMMSPVSPVLPLDEAMPIPFQASGADDWTNYFNMDDNENDTSDLRASAEASMKSDDCGSEHRRASLDDENARSDPLYQALPAEDGQYHCPFVAAENCEHPPVKLKCNYDKYIDSHLRPFRCKASGCEDVPFSSTACLLRHQREAHAMHGHGHKPNLCLFPDCERSKSSNGFPRRYNLLDHMKRVHGYNGSLEEAAPGTGRRPGVQGRVKSGRIEKTMRKPTKAELEARARAEKAKQVQQLRQSFAKGKGAMLQQLSDLELGSHDFLEQVKQLKDGLAAVEKMQLRLTELG